MDHEDSVSSSQLDRKIREMVFSESRLSEMLPETTAGKLGGELWASEKNKLRAAIARGFFGKLW